MTASTLTTRPLARFRATSDASAIHGERTAVAPDQHIGQGPNAGMFQTIFTQGVEGDLERDACVPHSAPA